ncbi:hypothetical protein GCM10027514_03170 [Azotobacter armeniacus]
MHAGAARTTKGKNGPLSGGTKTPAFAAADGNPPIAERLGDLRAPRSGGWPAPCMKPWRRQRRRGHILRKQAPYKRCFRLNAERIPEVLIPSGNDHPTALKSAALPIGQGT